MINRRCVCFDYLCRLSSHPIHRSLNLLNQRTDNGKLGMAGLPSTNCFDLRFDEHKRTYPWSGCPPMCYASLGLLPGHKFKFKKQHRPTTRRGATTVPVQYCKRSISTRLKISYEQRAYTGRYLHSALLYIVQYASTCYRRRHVSLVLTSSLSSACMTS